MKACPSKLIQTCRAARRRNDFPVRSVSWLTFVGRLSLRGLGSEIDGALFFSGMPFVSRISEGNPQGCIAAFRLHLTKSHESVSKCLESSRGTCPSPPKQSPPPREGRPSTRGDRCVR